MNVENITKMKAWLTIVFGAIASWFGILFIPIMLMALSNVTDYATGIMASNKKGEIISSYKSIHGIYKKVGMWVLVLVGWMTDVLVNYSISTFGIQFDIGIIENFQWPCAFACLVAVWVVVNEILSIIENIRSMGTNVPGFVDKVEDGMLDAIDKKFLEAVGTLKKDEDKTDGKS